jgi:glycosyltransferase involved in cell wall biosynthesis
MKKSQSPVVSIITVVYNDVHSIERTIRSIQEQTYTEIEHIIIDGGSTDGTVEAIKKYDTVIAYWKSEPDRGIYDAMNKGLATATGNYVWFINSGDEIYDSDTVKNLVGRAQPGADVYYGEAMYIDLRGEETGLRSNVTPHTLPERLRWQDMYRGMVVCHQSFLVKREIAPEFNLRYPHSGDIDWIINCLKNSERVVNTEMILSKYLTGGYSKKFHLRSLIDRYRVLQNHFGVVPNFFNHIAITVRALKFSRGKRL